MKTDPSRILASVHSFTNTLSRENFYSFYNLMTSLASPACGDKLLIDGEFLDLKRIVRKLRITVMYPRFNVYYDTAYTREEARRDYERLAYFYPYIHITEKNSVAKLMDALKIVVAALEE